MALADVVQLPVRRTAQLAGDAVDAVRHLADEAPHWGDVDDWGRDASLFRVITVASEIRWDVSTGGADRIPARRGALVVVNAQRFAFTPVFSSFAIGRACDRPARFVGRPDGSAIGALAQRLGGLLEHPDEITGALRANQLVVMSAEASQRPREVGEINHHLIGAALAIGAPIIPAATTSSPFSRRARVEIGRPVTTRRRRRDPSPNSNSPTTSVRPSASSSTRWATSPRAPHSIGCPSADWAETEMTYVRASDGTRLHYSVTGNPGGAPVLFIQGLGIDKHGWNLQRLATAPWYRSIAMDNRGAGRSDKPHGEYSLEQMADDAVRVLDDVGEQTAHVVGASMGGAISQIVAVRYPERVRSLTLACTAGRNHPWREELLTSWRDTALESGIGSMAQEAARWMIGPRSFRRLLPAISWIGPLALGRPSHAFAAQCDAIVNVDMSYADQMEDISVPTLVIVGNQDILTPRGDSEELAARIPTAELAVISGAAHGLMIENAFTFNTILLDFLHRAQRAHELGIADDGGGELVAVDVASA